jgi:predicted O-methyltransferase YrrM
MTVQTGQNIMGGLRRWDVLAMFMQEQGYKGFVEVGCKEGRTTGHILKNVPGAYAVAIDPWLPQEATADPTKETYQDWDFKKIEAEFWDNVGRESRCKMRRETSEEAAKALSDGNYDLVFIDALHDYEHVKQDIALWWPKVRVGGMLTGHDFNHKWPGVERAVAEAFNLMHVGVHQDSVWYVIKLDASQYRAT